MAGSCLSLPSTTSDPKHILLTQFSGCSRAPQNDFQGPSDCGTSHLFPSLFPLLLPTHSALSIQLSKNWTMLLILGALHVWSHLPGIFYSLFFTIYTCLLRLSFYLLRPLKSLLWHTLPHTPDDSSAATALFYPLPSPDHLVQSLPVCSRLC